MSHEFNTEEVHVETNPEAPQEEIEQPIPHAKVKKLSRIGSFMTGAAALLGVAAASNSVEAGERPTSQESSQKQEATTQEEAPKQHLKESMWRISSKVMGKMENGDIVISTGGGKFYEISHEDLSNLMKIAEADNAHKHVSGSENTRVAVEQARVKLFDAKIRTYIVEHGVAVDIDHLPAQLQESERARQEAINDMKN